MTKPKLPPEFVNLCRSVTAKRPKTVIRHILKHGFITTQELKERYGYNHPPRAAREVKEHEIPLEMFRGKAATAARLPLTASVTRARHGMDGRRIARF